MRSLQSSVYAAGLVAAVAFSTPAMATSAPVVLSAYGTPVAGSVPASVLGGVASFGVSPDGVTRYFGTYGGGIYKVVVATSATTTVRLPDFNGNNILGLDVRADGKVLFAADQAVATRSLITASLSPVAPLASHVVPAGFAFDVSVAPDGKHAAISGGVNIVIQDLTNFTNRTIVLDRTVESTLPVSTLAFSPLGTQIFFTNGADRLERINLDGTGRTTLATGLSEPNLGAVDKAGHLYVGTSDTTGPLTGQLLRFNADGTGRTVLLSGFDQVDQVALDVTGSVSFLGTKYLGQTTVNSVVRLPLRNLAPVNAKVTAVSPGRAAISFQRTSAAQLSFTVSSSSTPVQSCTTTGLSCTVTGLTKGKPVSFTVTANNGFLTSPKSLPTLTVKP
jgi:WD40 repeat protein